MARWQRWLVGILLLVLWGCQEHPAELPRVAAGNSPPTPKVELPSPTPNQRSQGPQVSTAVAFSSGTLPAQTPCAPATGEPRVMPAPGVPPKVHRTPLPFPQPGDDALNRAKAYVEQATLRQEGSPPHWVLQLRGSLPTPCHQLRVVVAQPDAGGIVRVEVYSVIEPDKVCTEVLSPFEAEVPLHFDPQKYRLLINGMPLEDLSGTPQK